MSDAQGGSGVLDNAQGGDAGRDVLPYALAALVVRQARSALVDGRMVVGTSQVPGQPVGLSTEDRNAMALVSRARLEAGLPDCGAEIHALLAACRHPLGDWLPVDVIEEQGLADVRLIDQEEATPTPEAEELARNFGSLSATLEEHLFSKFKEALAAFPSAHASHYYTQIREFVIRHPVVSAATLHEFGGELPSRLWAVLDQQFYIDIPRGWAVDDQVTCCKHCGDAMRPGKAGLVCRTHACAVARPAASGGVHSVHALRRCHQGIKQYWVEPGVDEIRLFDALTALGLPVVLFPQQDKVDLAFDDVGIDLKAYASPEILGRKLARHLGGLADYPTRWLVVPDALASARTHYLARLRRALGGCDVAVMTVSEAIERAASRGSQ